jgi:hypothetical protein
VCPAGEAPAGAGRNRLCRWRRPRLALLTACQSLVDTARHTSRAGQLNAAACMIRTWSGHAPGAPARAPARVSITRCSTTRCTRAPSCAGPHRTRACACQRTTQHHAAAARAMLYSHLSVMHRASLDALSHAPRCSGVRPNMASFQSLSPRTARCVHWQPAACTRALTLVWLHIGAPPPPPPPPLRVPTAHPPETQEPS